RLFRNPLVMFALGPIFTLVLQPRIVPRSARPRIKRSAMATNVELVVLVGGLCRLMGWRQYLRELAGGARPRPAQGRALRDHAVLISRQPPSGPAALSPATRGTRSSASAARRRASACSQAR
ncbi:MAG TPA: hypothetical protein VGH56_03370, partial [Solirubrobacteraceae bacterium]